MSVPVETVEARLARLEAPVKHEFCRLASERTPYAAAGPRGGGGAAAAAPQLTQRKSKNAMKRVSLCGFACQKQCIAPFEPAI